MTDLKQDTNLPDTADLAKQLREAEQVRKRVDERYRTLLKYASDGIHVIDKEGCVVEASDSFCRMLGYSSSEVLGMHITQFDAKLSSEEVAQKVSKQLASAEVMTFETQHRRKDGVIIDVEVTGYPLVLDGHKVLYNSSRDITERKRVEQSLRQSEVKLHCILESTSDGILAIDHRGKVIQFNQRFGQLWRIPQSLLDSQDDQTLLSYVASQLVDPLEFLGKVQALYGSDIEDIDAIRFKDGRIFERFTSPLTLDCSVIGRIWSFRDITERQRIEQDLHASLQEKEALLNEVHHRVKNNLQVISSLLRLESGRSSQPDTITVLQSMLDRILSMALLHETIYRSGIYSAIDLGSYLRQIATQAFRSLRTSTGVIRLRLDLESVQVSLDQAMPCGLLVAELLSNALKHGFPDGRSGEVYLELQHLEAGDRWRLRVGDTGVGLSADFESRRKQSLGLQLVSDLTKQLDGVLEIGPGATFTVEFKVESRTSLERPKSS